MQEVRNRPSGTRMTTCSFTSPGHGRHRNHACRRVTNRIPAPQPSPYAPSVAKHKSRKDHKHRHSNHTNCTLLGISGHGLRLQECARRRTPKLPGSPARQPSTWRGRSEQILLNQLGCEARKIGAMGEIFFLTSTFIELSAAATGSWCRCKARGFR